MQCDVRKYELPDGSSMFCAWVSRLGQKVALLQTADLQQSEASFGEVSKRTSLGSALLYCLRIVKSTCFIEAHSVQLVYYCFSPL